MVEEHYPLFVLPQEGVEVGLFPGQPRAAGTETSLLKEGNQKVDFKVFYAEGGTMLLLWQFKGKAPKKGCSFSNHCLICSYREGGEMTEKWQERVQFLALIPLLMWIQYLFRIGLNLDLRV